MDFRGNLMFEMDIIYGDSPITPRATLVPDKPSELMVAFSARNVEPIIASVNCPGEVKDLAVRADATEIDHILDFS